MWSTALKAEGLELLALKQLHVLLMPLSIFAYPCVFDSASFVLARKARLLCPCKESTVSMFAYSCVLDSASFVLARKAQSPWKHTAGGPPTVLTCSPATRHARAVVNGCLLQSLIQPP
eukprot:1162133-Pelagomonas_calceolata.AAC.3